MRKKRRKGRVTTETSVEDEIVHLRGLDLKGLRARWQSVLQRPAPDHLPRHLLFAIIAYRIQADRLGDLDHETRQLLDRTRAKESGAAMSARLVSFDQKRTEPTPGSRLSTGTRSTAARKRLAARCSPTLRMEDPIERKVMGAPVEPSEGSSCKARSRRFTASAAPRLWPTTTISSAPELWAATTSSRAILSSLFSRFALPLRT